jgi:hypothetical protein
MLAFEVPLRRELGTECCACAVSSPSPLVAFDILYMTAHSGGFRMLRLRSKLILISTVFFLLMTAQSIGYRMLPVRSKLILNSSCF